MRIRRSAHSPASAPIQAATTIGGPSPNSVASPPNSAALAAGTARKVRPTRLITRARIAGSTQFWIRIWLQIELIGGYLLAADGWKTLDNSP